MHEGLDRADIDDAALARAQWREERLRYVEDAIEIERDDVVPILRDRLGLGREGVTAGDAGIIDEDRDLPDLNRDLLCKREAIIPLGHIERKTLGLAAGLADLLGGFRDGVGVDVEQHHLCALARIAGRDRPADAGAGARDDGDVVCEQGHDNFLPDSFLSFMKG
jgi:hypothetical protein